jgi:hypothetical protein
MNKKQSFGEELFNMLCNHADLVKMGVDNGQALDTVFGEGSNKAAVKALQEIRTCQCSVLVSNCCDAEEVGNSSDYGLCPECRDHCVYVCQDCGKEAS